MEKINFKPAFFKSSASYRYICQNTRINSKDTFTHNILEQIGKEINDNSTKVYGSINLVCEVPGFIGKEINKNFGIHFSYDEEAYVIKADKNIDIFSISERGLMYGAMMLKRLSQGARLEGCLAYESPVCKVRGIKIYLPDPDDIDIFEKTIDMAAYYQYNTVVIEVGGAMQYSSHPEINRGWVKYCKGINSYSDRAKLIQEKTYGWQKNSIHAENGGGKSLSQEAVSGLVAYCRKRHMNVIPEIPLLSHCDYLLINHPELRERQEDHYADTYCPSNPGTYRLVFDLLDEVISVFGPEIIHIGHDEYYSIGLCSSCKDRTADDIYCDDIIKIHDYLAEKNVKTMIWGDKLLNAYLPGYGPCGGAEIIMHHPETGEITGIIPATYDSIDKIPSDTIIMHWYWSVDSRLEKEFTKRKLNTIYGNFTGPGFPNWKCRLEKGISGAIISNWSALKIDNLRRNGFIFNLIYSYTMFWKKAYDENHFRKISETVLGELYNLHVMDLKSRIGDSENLIEIIHTAEYSIKYKEFSDGTFIDKNSDTLGDYTILYNDGSQYSIPIVYGENISHKNVSWDRVLEYETTVYKTDRRIAEVAYITCPLEKDEETWYRFAFINPNPSSEIISMQIEKANPDAKIFLNSARIL